LRILSHPRNLSAKYVRIKIPKEKSARINVCKKVSKKLQKYVRKNKAEKKSAKISPQKCKGRKGNRQNRGKIHKSQKILKKSANKKIPKEKSQVKVRKK